MSKEYADQGPEQGAEYQATLGVPGTELLYDIGDVPALQGLQHITEGDARILLVPQPSLTDPNDPLRWRKWKKWTVLLNGCLYAFLGSVTGPIMAAGMIGLSETMSESLQAITYANGATLVCAGFFNTVWMPFAVKYGRRPVYLFSCFLTGMACVWLGFAATGTYASLVVGRAFLGAWMAPLESIVPGTITDVFFLHERGEKVSIYGLSLLGGNELGPMMSAFIIQALGMNWAFWIVAMFTGLNVVTIFLSMPETKFKGPRPVIVLEGAPAGDDEAPARDVRQLEDKDFVLIEDVPEVPKKSFLQELVFWSKGDPEFDLVKTFFRPFILLAYPTVVWSCFIYGFALGWNVILGASVAQLFAPPPYNFNSSDQGLVFLSPLIGSLVGTYLCGPLADFIANFYTKRNGGVREPEMRLPTCFIAAVLTFLGALMAGLTYQNKTHWSGPIVGFGILSVGAQMGGTLAMSYSLDCHMQLSVELMVTVATLKSFIAWIWTWVINDWIESEGMLTVFMVVATANFVVYLSTFGLYFWGKGVRVWLQKADLLARLGMN